VLDIRVSDPDLPGLANSSSRLLISSLTRVVFPHTRALSVVVKTYRSGPDNVVLGAKDSREAKVAQLSWVTLRKSDALRDV
jgi:hypothetical protein